MAVKKVSFGCILAQVPLKPGEFKGLEGVVCMCSPTFSTKRPIYKITYLSACVSAIVLKC